MKPELKQHLDDFELKINLDENSMLELKKNNTYLNAKEEIARLKKSKKKNNVAGQQDVDMDDANEVNEQPNRRRSRADYEFGQQQLAIQEQNKQQANQQADSMMSSGVVQPLGPGQSDQLMIDDSDSDEDY